MTILSNNGGNSNFVSISRKIDDMQAEINRLRDRNIELFNDLNYIACGFCKTADEAIQHAKQALNGESEK